MATTYCFVYAFGFNRTSAICYNTPNCSNYLLLHTACFSKGTNSVAFDSNVLMRSLAVYLLVLSATVPVLNKKMKGSLGGFGRGGGFSLAFRLNISMVLMI